MYYTPNVTNIFPKKICHIIKQVLDVCNILLNEFTDTAKPDILKSEEVTSELLSGINHQAVGCQVLVDTLFYFVQSKAWA